MKDAFVFDSVTTFDAAMRGKAAIAASHGGVYAAYLAASAGLKAVILCDAGVGRERAGIAGLDFLDGLGMPAAAIGHRSARIGDGQDCAVRGVISFVNAAAARLGVAPGMAAREALATLAFADLAPSPSPKPQREARHRLAAAEVGDVQVSALDSNALVTPADVGHVVVTGSHGGLLGGRAQTAIKVDVFAAVYNDADGGIDDAGRTRLPALDQRGIAGATVSAWSARIGEGLSTYHDGFVTAVNHRAAQCGGAIGMSAVELVGRLVEARMKERRA